ncbi:MAG: FHA domain-containing protein [Trebonia sp.]
MATCPLGHQSASDDFCDVCGHLIGAAPSLAPGAAPGEAGGTYADGTGSRPGVPCPRCGVTRAGQFCESCGYDFTRVGPDTLDPVVYRSAPPLPGPLPPAVRVPGAAPTQAERVPPGPAASAEWTAVVTADRAYYDGVQAAGGPDAAGIAFPAYCPQRRFRLAGPEVRIGRHSASSGIDPEIDLSVAPADPGVSRLHAVLLLAPDGTWSVVDPGSANGTAVNGSEIPRGEAVPLRDGDRIHLGAWTELRVVRGA